MESQKEIQIQKLNQLCADQVTDMTEIMDVQDQFGRDALQIAILQNSQKFILNQSQIKENYDKCNYSTLQYAVLAQNDQITEQLQKQQNKNNITPLMQAAAVNNTHAIQYLKQYLKCKTPAGITALMIAAAQNHVEAIKLLINENQAVDTSNRTAYDHALLNGSYQAAILLEEPYKEIHLEEVLLAYDKSIKLGLINNQQSCLQLIQRLLSKRASDFHKFERNKKEHQTALHLIAKNDLIQFINQLKDLYGSRDEQGRTALMYAAMNNSVMCFKALYDHEKTLQDNTGKTASAYAAINDSYECLSISYMDEYATRDNLGNTLLHYAAANDSLRTLNEIIDAYSGNVNFKGETALMYAAKHDSVGAVNILKPYEEKLVDINGNTPLHFACQNDSVEAVEKLLNLVGIENNDQGKAIDICLEQQFSQSLPFVLSEGNQQVLFKLIDDNKLKQLKLITDIARTGSSELAQNVMYGYKEQQTCLQLLQNKIQKGELAGCDLLTYSVLQGKSDFVAILSFVLLNSSYNDYTPLMLAVQKDQELSDVAIEALIANYAGRINKDGQNALIIGVQSQVDNIKLLQQLVEIEAQQVDKYGKKAIDYAMLFNRQELIKQLQGKQLTQNIIFSQQK